MNLWVHAISATPQQGKCTHFHTRFIHGSHWNISINFGAYLTIFSPHTIHPIIFGKASHFFQRSPWKYNPPKVKKKGPEGELIRLSDVISQD